MTAKDTVEASSSDTVHDETEKQQEDIVGSPRDLSDGAKAAETRTSCSYNGTPQIYNPRKPKWWKRLAGRATKAQKRAIRTVLDDHGLRLPDTPYGSKLDWDEVFSFSNPSVIRSNADISVHSASETAPTGDPTIRNRRQRRHVWLELGFGRGENLLALAHQYRIDGQFCLVGAEIHNPGIGIVCQRIEQAWDDIENNSEATDDGVCRKETDGTANHTSNGSYWKDYVSYSADLDPFRLDSKDAASTDTVPTMTRTMQSGSHEESHTLYSNLRIHAGDGLKLLSKIPSDSVAAILVTFPDPFPKEEEKQWRLIQVQTLLEFHRILQKEKSGHRMNKEDVEKSTTSVSAAAAGRFFLATDHAGYFDWTYATINHVNSTSLHFRLMDPCPSRMSWLPAVSTYEQKGWREGRCTDVSCWEAC